VRILVTGAGGFVGSNLVHVFEEAGDEVLAPRHAELDLTDEVATRAYVDRHRPDAIVHAAIWNAFAGLLSDRRKAWASFVDATRHVTDAANAAGARIVLISTDWVFDGTQGPAQEHEPPNPTTPYGVLKVLSEAVIRERAQRGTIARIAGVQGVHRARATTVREQDVGFGYLVLSAVDAVRAGTPFTVWEGEGLNVHASPVTAPAAGRLIRRALERDAGGVLHCCGAEHIDRVTLVRRALDAFGLDQRLLSTGPPPAAALIAGTPYDTRLASAATARALGTALPTIDDLLAELSSTPSAPRSPRAGA
jgi:dTDP-4-dehydrorhamnose reductase